MEDMITQGLNPPEFDSILNEAGKIWKVSKQENLTVFINNRLFGIMLGAQSTDVIRHAPSPPEAHFCERIFTAAS